MTESMTTLEAVYTVAPASLERARRLQFAVALLRGGTLRRQASGMVRRHFSCSHTTAWRVVDMAADLALIEPAAGADAAPQSAGQRSSTRGRTEQRAIDFTSIQTGAGALAPWR